MRASRPLRTLLPALAALLFASRAVGLERTATPYAVEEPAPWTTSGTVTLAYYNICLDWIYILAPSPGDLYGVVFEAGPDPCGLLETQQYFGQKAVTGYGFTGSLEVFAVDDDRCLVGAPVATRPILPQRGWHATSWGGAPVPGTFALVMSYTEGYGGRGYTMASDHPAPTGDGPPPCGTCYPSDRSTHSFQYGTSGSPDCPGATIDDFVCDVEFLWRVSVDCSTPTSQATWGRIKQLYR